MKLKILFGCLLLLMLSNCGSSKKTVRGKVKVVHKQKGVKIENLPDVNENAHIERLEEGSKRLNEFSLEYIKKYAAIAVREMHLHSIPASITLAQGVLESGSGRSELAYKSNNHFGIKCHQEWDGKRLYHDDDEKGECFRVYDDPINSFRDHSLFLKERTRYAFLFDIKTDHYKAWAKGLKKAGYATDPSYPDKLISLIERFDLTQFDLKMREINLVKSGSSQSNKTTVHTVKKGDTLYSVSKKYNVTVERIMELNKIQDQTIYLGQSLTIPLNL